MTCRLCYELIKEENYDKDNVVKSFGLDDIFHSDCWDKMVDGIKRFYKLSEGERILIKEELFKLNKNDKTL